MPSIEVIKPTEQVLRELDVKSWPTWSCEPSVFDWHYDDRETCYILAGDVTVTAGGEQATFGPGDLVIFPKGLSCTWHVRSSVKKHYRFG